ncbi:MAG: tetratricopeptide repeat protein [Planctomycetes bacterium]|nr:tetratricopeptide repeat protein [Planctomycetota bacterium]
MTAPPQDLLRARRLQDQGRFLAAADLLLETFRESPNDGAIAREIGLVLLAAGDPHGALGYLERARHADPADPAALRGSMEALHQLDRRDEAAHALLAGLMAGIEPAELAREIGPELAA